MVDGTLKLIRKGIRPFYCTNDSWYKYENTPKYIYNSIIFDMESVIAGRSIKALLKCFKQRGITSSKSKSKISRNKPYDITSENWKVFLKMLEIITKPRYN